MKKKLKIAIVEDSRPYLKLVSMFLDQLSEEEDVEIDVDLFDNPIDFKVARDKFDIVILDYVFRQYTYGANGFYLAKFTKDRLPESFVIIHSSYGEPEIKEMLKEFDKYIDAYSHKESDVYAEDGGLLKVIKGYMKKRWG